MDLIVNVLLIMGGSFYLGMRYGQHNAHKEFDKFLKLSQKKYEEKKKFDDMRSDLDSLKEDMNEIKTLLRNIMNK